MDISHLERFRADIEHARLWAEQHEPRGRDHVWGQPAAAVYEAIDAVVGHLGMIAAAYPHADRLARQHAGRLTDDAATLHAHLTEPPTCGAECVDAVVTRGTSIATTCELRSGHSGDHRPNPVERRLLATTARLVRDANMLSDGIRRAILDAPGRPGSPRCDNAGSQLLAELVESTASQLGRIAALLDHKLSVQTGWSGLGPPRRALRPQTDLDS